MSAFYSFRYPSCVKLLTDGAVLDEQHRLISRGTKVFTSPHLPLAITGRGDMRHVGPIVGALLSYVEGQVFDRWLQMSRNVVWAMRRNPDPLDKAELLIAGYSESDGPCHFIMNTHGNAPEFPPFVISSPAAQIGAGPPVVREDLPPLPDTGFPEDFPERVGLIIFDTMRRNCPAPVVIGGKLNLTTVTRDDVSTRMLHMWPDKLGSRIEAS